MRATERLGPAQFARVALHFEVGVAFGAAEAEGFGVVAHEGYAFTGVTGAGAEVAGFDPHFGETTVFLAVVWVVKIWCDIAEQAEVGEKVRGSVRCRTSAAMTSDFETKRCLHPIYSNYIFFSFSSNLSSYSAL